MLAAKSADFQASTGASSSSSRSPKPTGPIYAALWRTGMLLVVGAILAAVARYWLTREMIDRSAFW